MYVFIRNGDSWTEQAKFVASDGSSFDNFAYSVSLSGDTAIVGADYKNSAYIFVLRQENGDGCTMATECVSGFCVDGVCCNSACGEGDTTDCQACSVMAGAAANGTCAPIAAGFECRASAGACNVAESCDGATNDCPSDKNAADGTACPAGTCSSGICMGQGGAGGSGGFGESSSSSSSGGSAEPSENGGCACHIGAFSSSSSQFTIALMALAFVVIRRRRVRAKDWS